MGRQDVRRVVMPDKDIYANLQFACFISQELSIYKIDVAAYQIPSVPHRLTPLAEKPAEKKL